MDNQFETYGDALNFLVKTLGMEETSACRRILRETDKQIQAWAEKYHAYPTIAEKAGR